MSKELVRDAHHTAQLLFDTHPKESRLIQDLALQLAACRQARTNCERDSQRLATLSAVQGEELKQLRAANARLLKRNMQLGARVAMMADDVRSVLA